MSTTSVLPDVGVELREGNAQVGDVNLHYVEAGDGPLIVLLHGFPGVLVRLAAADRAARGGRLSGRRPRHAWLQPLLEARGLQGLRRRPARRRHQGPDRRARRGVGVRGRSRLGRVDRLDDGDEPPRGRRPARDPQRGPSAQALGGTAPPEPAAEVLVLLLLRGPGPARARGARQRLALLPALPARREPAVHAGGDRALRRGVVTAGRSGRDDQLLPRLGQVRTRRKPRRRFTRSRRRRWSSGASATPTSAPTSPSPSTTTCPTSTAWSACPTRRTGCITTRPSASTSC